MEVPPLAVGCHLEASNRGSDEQVKELTSLYSYEIPFNVWKDSVHITSCRKQSSTADPPLLSVGVTNRGRGTWGRGCGLDEPLKGLQQGHSQLAEVIPKGSRIGAGHPGCSHRVVRCLRLQQPAQGQYRFRAMHLDHHS